MPSPAPDVALKEGPQDVVRELVAEAVAEVVDQHHARLGEEHPREADGDGVARRQLLEPSAQGGHGADEVGRQPEGFGDAPTDLVRKYLIICALSYNPPYKTPYK
jgi:hypothetical protein